MSSQLGFFVPGEPRTGTPGEIHVKRRNFTTVNRALSAIGRLRSCVLLRRTPTQTASQNSASLPVHKLVFCGLLMTLSATSHGDFPHNVVGSMRADRTSELCFTACPRNGVLQSSDDTLLCNFALGLSPQRRWENAPCVCAVKLNRALALLRHNLKHLHCLLHCLASTCFDKELFHRTILNELLW